MYFFFNKTTFLEISPFPFPILTSLGFEVNKKSGKIVIYKLVFFNNKSFNNFFTNFKQANIG